MTVAIGSRADFRLSSSPFVRPRTRVAPLLPAMTTAQGASLTTFRLTLPSRRPIDWTPLARSDDNQVIAAGARLAQNLFRGVAVSDLARGLEPTLLEEPTGVFDVPIRVWGRADMAARLRPSRVRLNDAQDGDLRFFGSCDLCGLFEREGTALGRVVRRQAAS
jgi:hypothetical protein